MIDSRSTGKTDRNGKEIRTGDHIICYDGGDWYQAVVVFAHCAFRACPVTDWRGGLVDGKLYLQFNSSLLFHEIRGTDWIEVI